MTDPATKPKTFVDCVQKAAAIAVPQKVCRKKETPWMNAELKTLIQERNRLRRDMGANIDAWVAKTGEVLEKTQEAKRNTCRAHLDEVTRVSKNMPTSVGGRSIGRAGGLYENSEVVFVDYLAPLDKSLSRPLPLKNWRPP